MRKANRLIISNSIYLYIRLIIVSLIGLVVTRLVLKNLGINDFGIFTVVGGVVSLIGFVNTVMLSTSNRFIAYELGKGTIVSINKIFNISFNIHLFIAVGIFLIGLPLGEWYIHHYINIPPEKLTDAIWVLRFSLLGSVISFIGVPYKGLLIAKENFSLITIVEIVVSICKLIIAYIIGFIASQRLISYSALLAFVTVFPTILYVIYSRKNDFELVRYKIFKKWNDYKVIFSFSIWVGYGALASVGKAQGANLLINYFFGATLNAALGIASTVNAIVLNFARSVGRAISPQITKSYAAGEIKRTEDLVIAASKYTFLLLLIPALPIFLEIEYVLNLWLVDVPMHTANFIRLILIDVLIGSLNAGVPEAIFASGKIKWYQIIVNTIFLFSLPVAFFVLKHGAKPEALLYTYIGISLLALVIRQIILYYVVHFNTKRLLLKSYLPSIIVVSSLSPLFFLTYGHIHPIVVMIIAEIYLVLAIIGIGFNKQERGFIFKIMHSVVAKIKKGHV